VGLLLLSVSAATSLAEERVRGSLDLLLTTPLSTRSILAGKWLGTFRQATRVVIWPALMAVILLALSGRFTHFLLLLGLILAYCAGICSLGLALATWVSRLGRAVALCVSAYVVFAVGWMFFVTLVTRPSPLGWAMMMGSPCYGTSLAVSAVSPVGAPHPGGGQRSGIAPFFWISVHSGIAALLFAATLRTFDRCLGRVSDTTGKPIPDPRKQPAVQPGFDCSFEPYKVDHPDQAQVRADQPTQV
jgi:ABC-type Na+ efflux pump permease subunit